MLETPTVLSVEACPAAIIRLTVPRPEIGTVMGPAIGELQAILRAQDITPAGRVFTHHLRMDDAVFDLEVGIPTARPITAAGRARPGGLPAATVARAIHRGGYDGLSASWHAFRTWIDAAGHQRTADLWEVYLTGPDAEDDPANWRTELNQPVRA